MYEDGHFELHGYLQNSMQTLSNLALPCLANYIHMYNAQDTHTTLVLKAKDIGKRMTPRCWECVYSEDSLLDFNWVPRGKETKEDKKRERKFVWK
jgi:hypothetical protein